jgi:hypothetical protein
MNLTEPNQTKPNYIFLAFCSAKYSVNYSRFKYSVYPLAIDNISKLISLLCRTVVFIKYTKVNTRIPRERGSRMCEVGPVGPVF